MIGSKPEDEGAQEGPPDIAQAPMMTIRKASIMSVWSMPRVTLTVGATKAPPRPAKKQPMTKTMANTQLTLMPTAPTISLSTAAARAILPIFVLFTMNQNDTATMGPTIRRNRHCTRGKGQPLEDRSTDPWKTGHGYGLVLVPPDNLYQIPKDEGKSKSKQKKHEVFPLIEVLEESPFGDKTHEGHPQRCVIMAIQKPIVPPPMSGGNGDRP